MQDVDDRPIGEEQGGAKRDGKPSAFAVVAASLLATLLVAAIGAVVLVVMLLIRYFLR
ncbi:MAG: hypothetical protein AAGB00_07335 [Planctomycetota bacterium]